MVVSIALLHLLLSRLKVRIDEQETRQAKIEAYTHSSFVAQRVHEAFNTNETV